MIAHNSHGSIENLNKERVRIAASQGTCVGQHLTYTLYTMYIIMG